MASSLILPIVEANTIHLVHQIDALNALLPKGLFAYTTFPHSLTINGGAKHGTKLNHTVEFGMKGSVTGNDLASIEACYPPDCPPTIIVCQHSDASAFRVLADKEYIVTGGVHTFHQDLKNWPVETAGSGVEGITITTTYDIGEFPDASVQGFLSGGRPAPLLKLLAQSAAARPDTTIFSAIIDGQLAGTGAMAVLETKTAKIANFYIDSTLPDYRGKGVHRALIAARVAAARDAGCDLAIASARTSSGSARNIEKAGFKSSFKSDIYTKRIRQT